MKLQIFYNKEVPNVDSNHTCLAVINWDSALLLEKEKVSQKKKKSRTKNNLYRSARKFLTTTQEKS